MNVTDGYNLWAASYDSDLNKTRDLEKLALSELLSDRSFGHILELGCGTGKNTGFLASLSDSLTAIDFSVKMLDQAKEKNKIPQIRFVQADICQVWPEDTELAGLVTCSLVLEHIADLQTVFKQAAQRLKKNGWFYIGELHPFKQYLGSKARFLHQGREEPLLVFTHHISDYFEAGQAAGLQLRLLREWFDPEQNEIPRLITFIFEK